MDLEEQSAGKNSTDKQPFERGITTMEELKSNERSQSSIVVILGRYSLIGDVLLSVGFLF